MGSDSVYCDFFPAAGDSGDRFSHGSREPVCFLVRKNGRQSEEVFEKYGDAIKMYEIMPEVLAGAMGNFCFLARFNTEEEAIEFAHYTCERKV